MLTDRVMLHPHVLGPCGLQTVLTAVLNPGTYFVVMDGFASSSGVYQLAISCPTTAFTMASITCGSTVTGTTVGGVSTIGNGAPEVYYRFSAPFSGSYTLNSCGSAYDTHIHVYQAPTMATNSTVLGNLVASCDDCGPCGLRTVLTQILPAGEYIVIVDGFGTSSGAYTLQTTCPAANAPPPPASGYITCGTTLTGSTVGGTTSVGHAAPENWFLLQVNVSGSYTMSTCGSSFDT
jgi:hypothetical protein